MMNARTKVPKIDATLPKTGAPITPAALRLLRILSLADTPVPAKQLAYMLWPEEIAQCSRSLRKGGFYRSAGAFASRLVSAGLVRRVEMLEMMGYTLTRQGRELMGYTLTRQGREALDRAIATTEANHA